MYLIWITSCLEQRLHPAHALFFTDSPVVHWLQCVVVKICRWNRWPTDSLVHWLQCNIVNVFETGESGELGELGESYEKLNKVKQVNHWLTRRPLASVRFCKNLQAKQMNRVYLVNQMKRWNRWITYSFIHLMQYWKCLHSLFKSSRIEFFMLFGFLQYCSSF